MKKFLLYTYIFILIISSSLNAQEAIVHLNGLDFSRFPVVDLYVTIMNTDRSQIEQSKIENALPTIEHNGVSVPVKEYISVYELKEKGESELNIALVFDNSSSMMERMGLLEEAAMTFVQGITKQDYVSIIDFGDDSRQVTIPEYPKPIFAHQRINFSNAKSILSQKIPTKTFTQRTYLYDVLLYSLSLLNTTNVLGQRAIILFSDGNNIGSTSDYETVTDYIAQYDIPIYAIDLQEVSNDRLRELAELSGGEYYFVEQAEDLVQLYKAILQTLKNQYRITYSSPDQIITNDVYNIRASLKSPLRGEDKRTFKVNGEQIGYYNLLYLESQGTIQPDNYLNYLLAYPNSKFKNDVTLLMGNYNLRHGTFAEALHIYNYLLRDDEDDVYLKALSKKAEVLRIAKEFAQTEEALKNIINNPNAGNLRPEALLELAELYTADGIFQSALDSYNQLVEEYEGTEWAANGLLNMSLVNVDMGNLDVAAKNLQDLMETYEESEVFTYGQFELAKIEEQRNNIDKALDLYEKITITSTDQDLITLSNYRSANINYSMGNFPAAISLLSAILQNTDNVEMITDSRTKLEYSYLMNNNIFLARKEYEELPEDLQQSLLQENPLRISSDNETISSLLNASFVKPADGISGENIISIAESEDLRERYPVLGPMYSVDVGYEIGDTVQASDKANASITVMREWLMENQIVDGETGVYLYHNGQFVPVTDLFNPTDFSFDFEVPGSGLYAILTQKPEVITLYNIYFDLGSSNIRKDSEKNLFEMVDYLKLHPELKMEINGHTDNTGSEETNTELSLKRAESIKAFLEKHGIDGNRITTRGLGSQYPLVPNTTEENRQKNRRTEFILISESQIVSEIEVISHTRFKVLIDTFTSTKDAFDTKKELRSGGFSPIIITDKSNNKEVYELVLGIYDSEAKAKEETLKFKRQFKQFDLQISEW